VAEIEKDKEFGMNEYLRSFKVALYQVKEDDIPEPAVEFVSAADINIIVYIYMPVYIYADVRHSLIYT